ncbi:ABC transporter ATP-binding protein [Cohnella fermenti]|uniref:ABC transporter ATP-binding protein n=1 Tax=Cohnella fermenti TaxID=2565925 RepID=A0A4S4C071_9BACL|nr:ABC transporter ATP-binding protein [Cohnella fermenti]THF80853.1 ABC transporter ATP-binding protein [Cohnella fermenti]
MSSDTIIDILGMDKMYRIFDRPIDRLKYILSRNKTKYYKEFWALRAINLAINKGESIGLIGKNGSGKSTLLQIIAGTLSPSAGNVRISGRIAALLELGSGFNPEFTGRENAIINGTIMGLTIEEAKQRMPQIEDFAEIGEFIDQPVKTYSSGMFVRLAFACAVHVDPDILIVDEALAVGDMQFQLKCIEKMKSFKEQGKTIIFVSHDMYSIRNFCDSAVWLMNGSIYKRGNVNLVTKEFEDYMKRGYVESTIQPETPSASNLVLDIANIEFRNERGEETDRFRYGEGFEIIIQYNLKESCLGLVGGVSIFDQLNTWVCGLNTKLDNYELMEEPGQYRLTVRYANMNLMPGTYAIDVGFFESSGLVRLDYKSRCRSFQIQSSEYFAEGLVCFEHSWNTERKISVEV